MGLWLFIGVVFAAVLLLALWRARRGSTSTQDDQSFDPYEHKRGADIRAANAARETEARIAPRPGGFSF